MGDHVNSRADFTALLGDFEGLEFESMLCNHNTASEGHEGGGHAPDTHTMPLPSGPTEDDSLWPLFDALPLFGTVAYHFFLCHT